MSLLSIHFTVKYWRLDLFLGSISLYGPVGYFLTQRTHVLYEIFLLSGSYNSLNLDGINNKGHLHINMPPLIKILLTVSFLQVKVPRELVHCALLAIITTAGNGKQNMSVSGHYTYTRCHESWQHKRISSVQKFSRLILFSLLFS
jgi:hypothetical protein